VQRIRLFGDPVLRTPADIVTDFDKQLRTLVADLAETMLDAPGVGLAAPQIGVGLRVFTFHVDDAQSGHLVNPVLHFPTDDEQDGPEGCLSIPGLSFDCRRHANVVAHGQNMFGDPITVEGTATLARCLEHETDHLDGVLFIDRLELDARKVALRALLEATWWGESAPVVKVSPHPTRGLAL
jgi:peptide deformylase